MSSPLFPPKFQFPAATVGSATAGYKVNTYAAGTSTPQATYTDSTLATPNANPVVMDANGEANIWLGNLSYKFVGTDAVGTVLWTVDNVSQAGVGQLAAEWVATQGAPTFLATTQIALAGTTDVTLAPYFMGVGTRIKTQNTGGTIYSTVKAVSGNTITCVHDSGVFDAGISAAWYGIEAAPQRSAFRMSKASFQNGANVNMVSGLSATLNGAGTVLYDYLGEMIAVSGYFGALVAGTYRLSGIILYNETNTTTGIAGQNVVVQVIKNLVPSSTYTFQWNVADSTQRTVAIPFDFTLAVTLSASLQMGILSPAFAGGTPTASLLSFNVERLA